MGVTSTGASMEDMENMKASTKVTSTRSYTKASTKASMGDFMEVMEPFVKTMEAFI